MNASRAAFATLALAVVAIPGSLARADLAPPALADVLCPRGSISTLPEVQPGATDPRGRPVRPYPYCAASTCTSDADCTAGMTCSTEEVGLCVEDRAVEGGGSVRAVRERGCEPDGTCLNMQSTCERARRCVAPEPAEPEAAEPVEEPEADAVEPDPAEAPARAAGPSGCGCRAAGTSSRAPWLFALAPLALLARRRRA